jgi:hypothetical protein
MVVVLLYFVGNIVVVGAYHAAYQEKVDNAPYNGNGQPNGNKRKDEHGNGRISFADVKAVQPQKSEKNAEYSGNAQRAFICLVPN